MIASIHHSYGVCNGVINSLIDLKRKGDTMFNHYEYLLQEQAYLEENKELWVDYNPHPRQLDVRDCVKRQ